MHVEAPDTITRPVTGPLDWTARAAPPLSLSTADYVRFRDFVLERTGLDFTEDKRPMLERGLAQLMTAAECASLDQLYRLLHAGASAQSLWENLVSALTVGETYFFRNTSHFDALARRILPEVMARAARSGRRIRIWSAGCATGEEPYSVAILLREMIPNLDSWNITLLATDINREALRKAQAGVYGAWSFRGVDPRVRDTYFQPDGKHFVIDEAIKRMVTFAHLNLVADPYPSLANNTNAMDVILCRNVTIYFNARVTVEVVRRFHACLTEGGWLIPGASEPNMVYYGDFEPRNFPGTVVYQKPAAPAPETASSAVALPQTPPFIMPSPMPRSKPTAPLTPQAGQPAQPVPDAYLRAQALLQTGQLDEALRELYRAIDDDSSFAPAYYTLGKVYANTGALEQAQHWCERAIHIDRLQPEPYYTLSMIYQQHGLLDQAVEALKRAVYLDREFVMAHFNLAEIYARRGETDAARKSLQTVQRLLSNKPKDAPVPEGDGLVAGRLLEMVGAALADAGASAAP
jgi:chemotaxis protein methyltransferase CheR